MRPYNFGMGMLQVGETYRYSKKLGPELEASSGFPNLLNLTWAPGFPLALLERGISPIGSVTKSSWGSPKPAILISSSPHKAGSDETPWHDVLNFETGSLTYFGDNKAKANPTLPIGNQALVREFTFHTSGDRNARALASPLLFFLRVPVGSKRKGFVKFMGLCVISKAELVTQYNSTHGFFPNFVFGLQLISLEEEGNQFDWSWITARRSLPIVESNKLAPEAWLDWVERGVIRSQEILQV